MNDKKIKILIVEDHKLIRIGIKAIFDESDEFSVISEASTGKEAISRAIIDNPSVILLDLGLPDISGIKVLKEIIEKLPDIKVIILTSHEDNDEIIKCISIGAFAYIIKDISSDMLINIVKSVNAGAMWFDPKIVPKLREKSNFIIPQRQISRAAFRNSHSNLTQREYEVLRLIVDGKSNQEIAGELCISEHTAKAHVCNIIQKLVVDDRTQAAVKAIKDGLV